MNSIKRGLGFGITSGIITTLGLMIGLYSGTSSKQVVLAGILVIAIADACSDAFGIHISEELANKKATEKQVWTSTASTFIFKLISATILAIPVMIFSLKIGIITSIILAFVMLTSFNYFIAKQNNKKPLPIIFEHLTITIIVIAITYSIGKISTRF